MRALLFCSLLILSAVAASARAQAQSTDQAKLQAYIEARQAFESEEAAYWNLIAEKRRARFSKRRNNQDITLADYVLIQPPVYSGPAKPAGFDSSIPETLKPVKEYVPVVADILKAAAEHYGFVPRRPQNEMEYKKAYAGVASVAGLTKDQIVRIYAFECGGNGAYDLQAGLEIVRPGARAITTALGYNQLLHVNSVELLAEQGDQMIAALQHKAGTLTGNVKKALEQKISIIQRMIAFSRTVPDQWREHEKLAKTPQGLGIHALNLDVDVGPLLQTQKLINSVAFARMKGHKASLSAAELEMMNLTGDGNGFDMVMMPQAMREKVPTSNFFQQKSYTRNPVAIRNNVVSKLIAATNATMDEEARRPGAKELAAAF
ncbi:MAG TPA: hypothetical protein VHN11_03915 [Xanthobacteraceae bacterium]|jgi:hypothetical protein|nr:hypothetical protein [Xanthobacteraceae bacterium]